MVGVLGLIATWRLARLVGGERAGFFAALLLALTPDYYGHMLVNPKDAPFACGMTWTLYLSCCTLAQLPRPRLGTILGLGLALGLTLGTRIGGVLAGFYLVVTLGLYVALLWRNGASGPETRATASRLFLTYLPALILAYLVMGLFWPWSWQSPLNPLIALSVFSHFTWPNQVLAAGVVFKASDPPIWYLPLMLAVKLPELVLTGLGLAACFAGNWLVKRFHQHRRDTNFDQERLRRLQFMMVTLAALFPVVYFLVARPEVYNGIRHFLFVLPPLVVLAAVAFDRLWTLIAHGPRVLNRAALAAFSIAVVIQAWIMMELHPNQCIYYNALVGGVRGAAGRFELDYWGTSVAQAAAELATYVQDENGGKPITRTYKVLVCANPESAMYFLPKQFELTRVIAEGDFFIGLTLSDCDKSVDGQQIIRVERFGAVLSVVKDRRDLKDPALDIANGTPPGPSLSPSIPAIATPMPRGAR